MYLAIVTAPLSLFFFFNDTATTEIYTLSLHDALPISFMTQALKPKSTDRVLEIGTGSGYQAAVLSELVAEVYTIEIVRPLAQRAATVLNALGYKNVLVKGGDGYKGWP